MWGRRGAMTPSCQRSSRDVDPRLVGPTTVSRASTRSTLRAIVSGGRAVLIVVTGWSGVPVVRLALMRTAVVTGADGTGGGAGGGEDQPCGWPQRAWWARSGSTLNGNVGYQNCPNAPVQHAVRRASLLAATRLMGKPTRTGGALSAEERKRRGSRLLLCKPSQPSPLAGVCCIRRECCTILPAQAAVTR